MSKDGATIKINWHDQEVLKKLDKHLTNLLELAGEFFKASIVKNVTRKSNKAFGPSPATGKAFSHAGEARLAKSYFFTVDKGPFLAGRGRKKQKMVTVGTPLKYGKHLETGTSTMKPRPNLTRTLRQERRNLTKILTKSLPG